VPGFGKTSSGDETHVSTTDDGKTQDELSPGLASEGANLVSCGLPATYFDLFAARNKASPWASALPRRKVDTRVS
jgi:hypothetical protein